MMANRLIVECAPPAKDYAIQQPYHRDQQYRPATHSQQVVEGGCVTDQSGPECPELPASVGFKNRFARHVGFHVRDYSPY